MRFMRQPARFIGLVVSSRGASAPGGFRPQLILNAPKSVLHFQPNTPMPKCSNSNQTDPRHPPSRPGDRRLRGERWAGQPCAPSADGDQTACCPSRTLCPRPWPWHPSCPPTRPLTSHAGFAQPGRHTAIYTRARADPGVSARGSLRQPLRLHPHVADLEQLRTRHPGHEPELLRQPPGSSRRSRDHASQPGRQKCQSPRMAEFAQAQGYLARIQVNGTSDFPRAPSWPTASR